jgi:hypothetical protein
MKTKIVVLGLHCINQQCIIQKKGINYQKKR